MTIIIGTPHTHNAGYFRNDDRPSGGKLAEADVQTCKHCQAVVKMQEWALDGGWCAKCESPLCNNPACVAETARVGCVPYMQKVEQQMNADVKLQQYLKIAGLETPVSRQPLIITG